MSKPLQTRSRSPKANSLYAAVGHECRQPAEQQQDRVRLGNAPVANEVHLADHDGRVTRAERNIREGILREGCLVWVA